MNKFNEMYSPPDYINSRGERIITEDVDQKIIGFIHDNNEKAKTFLRANRGWKSAESCMAIFYGDDEIKIPTGLSRIQIKKLRRQAREAVANATNIRPRWEHRSYGDKHPIKAQIYDDLKDDWWYMLDGEAKLKEALQFAAGGSTGYIFLWPEYHPATGRLEIVPTPLNWKQVLPYHAGMNSDVDSLYGITVWLEMPLPDAHRKYPNHIDIIKPDRNTPSFFANKINQVKRTWKGVLDRVRNNPANAMAESPYPSADIFLTWVRDETINETGRTIVVGEQGAYNSYKVPSKFDENNQLNKFDELRNESISSTDPRYNEQTESGISKYPYVKASQCRLFPYQRQIISTSFGVIYDGPPIYLNRYRPIIPFYFEKVAGEFLGINLIRDGRRLEESVNKILQAIEDKIVGKISPPIAIDPKIPQSIRIKLKRNVRTMIGKVFEYSPAIMEKAITPLLPVDFFKIESGEVDMVKYLQDTQDYLMGTNDSSFLTKLNQMPAADTQEAYLRSLGALSTDHERGIERSLIQLAKVWLDFAPQVYTTPRIISKTKYGVTVLIADVSDFDPKSLIPKKEDYPNCSFAERWAREMENFTVYAAPFSLQENISQTNRLTLLTLNKVGVPISNERLYDTFIPDGKFQLEFEKWKDEQFQKALIAAELQRQLALANQAADPQNQLASGVANAVNSAQQNGNEGRPNSFQKPPTLQAKANDDGSQRTTVATS